MTHFYEIRIEGHLEDRWQDWFDDMSVMREDDGATLKCARSSPAFWDSLQKPYTPSQMSYDLRRLRLKGLIARIARKHTYLLTTYGRKIVYLMTKLQQRIFNITSATLETTLTLPSQLANAFCQLDQEVDKLVTNAQLAPSKS